MNDDHRRLAQQRRRREKWALVRSGVRCPHCDGLGFVRNPPLFPEIP